MQFTWKMAGYWATFEGVVIPIYCWKVAVCVLVVLLISFEENASENCDGFAE